MNNNEELNMLKEENKIMNAQVKDLYINWVKRTDELSEANKRILELEKELAKAKCSLKASEKGNLRLSAKLKKVSEVGWAQKLEQENIKLKNDNYLMEERLDKYELIELMAGLGRF